MCWRDILSIATAALGASYLAACASGKSADHCKHGASDQLGYVYQACRYVREHHIKVTADPNTWRVRSVVDRVVNGKQMKVVFYSCCYIGDAGYFDLDGKLVEYRAGPK